MKGSGGEWSLKKSAQELIKSAAEAGISRAWELAAFTPREIEMELAAIAQQRRQENHQLDLLAWLTGRYALYGMHAPRRYPRRPDAVACSPRRMSAEEMKRVFVAMAAEGRKNGGC